MNETYPQNPQKIVFSIMLTPFVIAFVNKKMSIRKRVFAALAAAVTGIVIPIGAVAGIAYIGYRSVVVPINGLKVFIEDAKFYIKEDSY